MRRQKPIHDYGWLWLAIFTVAFCGVATYIYYNSFFKHLDVYWTEKMGPFTITHYRHRETGKCYVYRMVGKSAAPIEEPCVSFCP